MAARRRTLIDLSDTLSNDTSAFEPNSHQIKYVDHVEGLRLGAEIFKFDRATIDALFPDGRAWAVEQLTISSHSGTHVDAPYHYGPSSGGQPARTIDRVPLEWCYSDAVLLDMTHKARGEAIGPDDIRTALDRIEYRLEPLDIVLVRTGASAHFKTRGYELMQPGLNRAGVEFLVESGVKVVGIDAWTIDRPFDVLMKETLAGAKGRFWEAHFYGTEQEYCQIEKLTNLAAIPRPYGFQVICFPVKLLAASAGWTRAVAVIEEEE